MHFTFYKADIVGKNFKATALIAIFVGVIRNQNSAVNGDGFTFVEIAADKLCEYSSGNDIGEIPFDAPHFCCKDDSQRQYEGCYSNIVRRCGEVRDPVILPTRIALFSIVDAPLICPLC